MSSVKEIIAKNLTELRKSHKLTQQTLAEKLNYSDKAISRWERGETLPDIETLCTLCDLYGVRFEYLLQQEQPTEGKNPFVKGRDNANKIFICLISAATVWLCATMAFIWSDMTKGLWLWNLFIWALPCTGIPLAVCNRLWWRNKIFGAINTSYTAWTLLLSIYIEALLRGDNMWFFFILGVPVQIIVIFSAMLKSKGRE